jgi:hypothetical protein
MSRNRTRGRGATLITRGNTVDSKEKKLFAMLSSSSPGERANAAEALYAHHQAQGRTVSDHIAEFEQFESENAKLSKHVAKLQAANERWRKAFVSKEAVAARLRLVREWIAFNRARAAGGAAVLAIGAVCWNFYGPGTGPAAVAEREKLDKAFYAMAASWSWGEGETEPRVYTVERQSYWVIGRGNIESDNHADAFGQPVEMHCLHLYARPAVADYGAYLKPGSRNAPFGPFSWPERATSCKPATTRKADK